MNDLDIQKAIFQHLQNPLDDLLARLVLPDGTQINQPAVYDHVPQAVDDKVNYPYVVVGDTTGAPFDTDTSEGNEATVTLHVWSRERGRSETKAIQRAIYLALHKVALPVDNAHTVDSFWEFSETILDPDGITRHGVIRFRVTTEEV